MGANWNTGVGWVFLVFMVPQAAWAYLDPGSGSYVIQIVLASIVGVIAAARSTIASLWGRLWGRARDNSNSASDQGNKPTDHPPN